MTKYMKLAWLALALMTADTAATQTYNGTAFTLAPPSGVGPGQFINGNGDAATFSTVDNEIDSWWGLGIKSQCCSNYVGYGIVFDARAGSIYTQGNVGIGTTTPGLYPLFVKNSGHWQLLNLQNPSTSPGAAVIQFDRSAATANPAVWTVGYSDYNAGDWPLGFTVMDATSGSNLTRLLINASGNVGIGTTSPQYKLSVNGTIQAKEVLVNTGWADYVFQPNYRVRPLAEVAAFIKANHHLPDIPSESEVKENGVSLGDMQAKLLAKIEELTLQMIQLDKKNRALAKKVAQLKGR
ncbi:tail fiber protein [Terriglobus saanensis]|uniref:Uncharacterized protein n=1 Tax=Terriglobus saanensis (strain ATCC BAA-1853 / DSM 23119 / SP1PR4) TaxID=401053 RepID=E8V7H9_TERSS|nr:tail fiber protein [Terriglobus saanensis]ADV83953.1 hypothetical protein AciPR4_3197 [Terriglobus saanensis SP1PR4]